MAHKIRSACTENRSSAPGPGITTRTGSPPTRSRTTCRHSRKPTCHDVITTCEMPDGSHTGPVLATRSVRHSA
jgi:hypothetical protein